MKIGLLGGTFDPFHRGHLEPVLAVREEMEWDRMIFIPAWQQPFKLGREHASSFHRFAMAVLATEGREDCYVSEAELQRESISYTVDTLEALRATDAESTFDWIIGDDNLLKLTGWRNIERILELANFAVLTRSGGGAEGELVPAALRDRVMERGARGRAGAIVFTMNATVPVSSTEIRRRVGAGERVDDFVDPRVSRYIQHYGLYKEASS
jgi:nicotinate-nucleotide adenylyltransferase